MEQETISVDSLAESKPKRIATLDFLRGFAIFMMIVFHLFMNMYNYYYMEDLEQLMAVPIALLILLGVLAFFGTWHAFFLFISSIVHGYIFTRKAINNEGLEPKILLKPFLTGVALMILGWLEQAFGYYGYFGEIIRGASWGDFSPFLEAFFWTETLRMIGFCMIINSVILYLMHRKEGYNRIERSVLIYIFLIFAVILIAAIFRNLIPGWEWLNGGQEFEMIDLWEVAMNKGTFGAWLVSKLFSGLQPLFPFLVTSFIGSIFGMILMLPELSPKTPLIGIICGLAVTVTGVLMIVCGAEWTTIENYTALSTYFIRLGMQIIVIWSFLGLVEFRGHAEGFANNPIIKFFRLWSIISLTIYLLQIVQYIPRLILHAIFGPTLGLTFMIDNSIPSDMLWVVFLANIFIVAFYHLGIYLWSKVNFIGSFEWCIVQIQGLFTGKKSKRLNVDLILNNVQWINFPHKLKSEPIEQGDQPSLIHSKSS
jgi:hypothetical protein